MHIYFKEVYNLYMYHMFYVRVQLQMKWLNVDVHIIYYVQCGSASMTRFSSIKVQIDATATYCFDLHLGPKSGQSTLGPTKTT